MVQLRKFLCECFGWLALLFLFVSALTLPTMLRFSQAHRTHGHERATHGTLISPHALAILGGMGARLILVIPLVFAVLYGMAWWTVKKRKPAARGWAIAASLAMALTSIPLLAIEIYFPHGFPFVAVAQLALGIAGLVAFWRRDSLTQTPAEAPRPPRIAGDGTSSVLDSMGWILDLAGFYAGWFWWARWGRVHQLHFLRINWILLAVLAGLVTSLVHEIGHAVVGLALGMKLRSFAVGPFQWRIRNGKWKFRFELAKTLSAGGAVGVVPTRVEQSHWREICMIAAGPVSNLLIGVAAFGIAFTAQGRRYEQAWWPLAILSTFCLTAFVVNLLPLRPQAHYSDGARILQLLKGGPWADLQRAFNVVTSSLVTPMRPRDYDIEAIQRASRCFTQGQHALLLRLWAVTHFLDCGRIAQACEASTEAESIYHESASDIPGHLHLDFVFDAAYLRRDAAGARWWWERMESKKLDGFSVDYWLAKVALAWIEGRREDANEAWDKGNLLARKLPAAGAYDFDRHRFALLREALDEVPSAGYLEAELAAVPG